jgi:flagellar motor switch protein FliM
MITMLRMRPEPSGVLGDKLIRESYFERVTDLPISSVCMTANHARAQLSKLLARELTLDVFAPVLVKESENEVIFEGANLYSARGSTCDVFVIFRPRDARRIAAGVFGEECSIDGRPLSSLEERALERIAQEVVALCVPFCGEVRELAQIDPALGRPRCVTYFELRIGAPLDAVIGIGLSKDPGAAFGGTVERATLTDVKLDVRARFAEATLDARDVAGWSVGTIVRLDTRIGAATTLRVGDCIVASGDCGIRADSHAVAIRSAPLKEVIL